METFSALLAICAGNSTVTDEFPTQRPVTRSFDVFLDLRLNKRFSKQSGDWWFETLSSPLWRHCNDRLMWHRELISIFRKTDSCVFPIISASLAQAILLHSGAIWRQVSWPTLAQVMACLPAGTKPLPERYQCIPSVSEVQWHSPASNFTSYLYVYNAFENCTSKIYFIQLRGKNRGAIDIFPTCNKCKCKLCIPIFYTI